MVLIEENKIGDRIRDVRISRGLTVYQLASMIGFTNSYLARIKYSVKSSPISTLSAIADALNGDILIFL